MITLQVTESHEMAGTSRHFQVKLVNHQNEGLRISTSRCMKKANRYAAKVALHLGAELVALGPGGPVMLPPGTILQQQVAR